MPDITFSGNHSLWRMVGVTPHGQKWIADNVSFEPWQGTPEDGVWIEGGYRAGDIATMAVYQGLRVSCNGKELEYSGERIA